MNSSPLLQVNNLSVSFKVQRAILHAVQKITFSVQKGEMIGIVGESGCGKSAAVKAIVQLLPKHTALTSGEVIYGGKNLLKLEEPQIRQIRGKEIGMIFQDPMTSLNPTKKIGQQIVEGYLLHHRESNMSDAHDYAIQLLELVGIPHPSTRIDHYPHTLSGGMRQRAMIALALASKPKLIIADEPTTSLDVTIQAQILELLCEIKQRMGTSFIFITHDLSVVARYCDSVIVMYGGKVVESAPVESLFASPSHPYTKGLLQSLPRLDMTKGMTLEPIEGSPPNLMESIPGCAFASRCKLVHPKCLLSSPSLHPVGADHLTACWQREEDESSD